MTDGYINKCKECTKSEARERRANNPDKAREIDRKKYLKRRDEAIKKMVEYSRTNIYARLRKKANAIVRSRKRSGIIEKTPCEICNELDVEAHHDSYEFDKFDKIRWLCKKHHKEWHKKNTPLMPTKEEIEIFLDL